MSTRFITIPLHYLTVKDWELCKRVNVQLPHFTDNNIIECMVVGIELDINAPYICTVEFAMLETTGIPEDTTVQNVVTVLTGDNLWQNTTDTGNENIQNV
jgi:hypothetical protein